MKSGIFVAVINSVYYELCRLPNKQIKTKRAFSDLLNLLSTQIFQLSKVLFFQVKLLENNKVSE